MMNLRRDLFLVLVFGLIIRNVSASYSYDNVVDDSASVHSLTPNQFYKICPKQHGGKSFGKPVCGDGTDFCFYFSRPSQRKANNDRILIELMGGGACWDAYTCNIQAEYLTFPEKLDSFLGLSCSEINAGLNNNNNQDNNGEQDNAAINMLCAQTIGETDFSTYNTVVIPYCTQDVHAGSNILDYSDNYDNGGRGRRRRLEDQDAADSTVRHMGAHNVMSTLRWVFRNFPVAKHVALTGCSAGGTGVPIVYDLVRKNYNSFGIRSVQINAIADSPVYLTPSYFLENALDNWNPARILRRIGFNYNKYRYSEEYTTQIWDYILRKGANKDRWGFVSHADDPVSLMYYQYMSGGGDDGNRRLEDNNLQSQWYSELTSSVATIQDKHKNVESFWINDEGHCSFGLYYALQQDGFEDWAGQVFRESSVSMAPRPAIGAFVMALFVGVGLATSIVLVSRKQSRSVGSEKTDSLVRDKTTNNSKLWKNTFASRMQLSSYGLGFSDSFLSDESIESEPTRTCRTMVDRLKTAIVLFLSKVADCPVTVGLALLITVFFWTMIITEGFAHPLNNPSLGPSAIGLSRYGINNPSLIIYEHQLFRILTSNFLCSGVLTYLITMAYLVYTVRSLEKTLSSPFHMVWMLVLVALGINLMYAWLLEGASCSSLALVLGLQTCHFALKRRRNLPNVYTLPLVFVVLVFLISFLFPFNDQWMMLSSILLFGPVAGFLGLKAQRAQEEKLKPATSQADDQMSKAYLGEPMELETLPEVETNEPETQREREDRLPTETEATSPNELGDDESFGNVYSLRKEFLYLYVVWFIVVAFGMRFGGPDTLFVEPFYTGCDLYYSTDVANIASGFYDGNGDRRLEEGDDAEESMCAEFCVPLVTSRFVTIGVKKLSITVSRGQCYDAGYGEHVAAKTFAYMSYALDVEIYYSSSE